MNGALTAIVFGTKNTMRHLLGFGENAVEIPVPIRVRIVEDDAGVFLFRESKTGEIADTWHESVEDAKQQAMLEFELGIWESV